MTVTYKVGTGNDPAVCFADALLAKLTSTEHGEAK